ncbi:MAG: transporter substrate-binding domain-containing protein, partial [Slackia isoflavoniconvertens]|nr:transporter substrate-binding domain-containing protein [Slackia isoflavoniconvertens]
NPTSDLVSAFSLVETGKSQYVAADAVIGSYAALVQSVDVQPIALLGSKGGYCIGVNSSNQELQKAISAALTAVRGNGVFDAVCTKWLGSPMNLDVLSTIEVSSSKSVSAGDDSDEKSAEGGSAETASSSTAGANAVQPGSTR